VTVPEGTAAVPGAPDPAHLSIGEVLAHLRHEFPDITISKLRFLEAEGLVEPARTPAGYRKYRPVDVSRLRFVLAAQRDRYLPLRVIREQLAAWDAGPPRPAAGEPPHQRRPALFAVGPPVPAEPAEHWLSRAELLARTGLDEPLLASLEEYGLVDADAGAYGPDALAVAAAAGQLCRYGLTARHLRIFRTAADREVDLVAQVAAPLARQPTAAGRGRAAEAVRELAALSQQLHEALVRAGLRRLLER